MTVRGCSLEDRVTIDSANESRQPMQSLLAFPFETNRPLAAGIGEGSLTIRAADSWGTRSSASMLINRQYSSRGYRSNSLSEQIDPNQLTLVASDNDAVIGTLTVGFDSQDLLLADDLFADEVNALRGAGRQLCEFTKLAVDGLVQSQYVLAAMFHVAFIYAHRIRGCDSLLIEVNPRHIRYYEAKLGFKAHSPERLNRRVNAPAVLLSLDLWYAQEQLTKFGGNPALASMARSLYPFGFSQSEEAGIIGRLQNRERATSRADAAWQA